MSESSTSTAPAVQPTLFSREEKPRVPVDGQRNVLVTSALPYVNNVPHLGNLIGAVLSADVYSRYCRLVGYNSLYVCGTDEYGTATETKAIFEGLTPQEICDKYHAIHADIYRWFGVDFDKFGRTTTPQQTEIAQDIFLRLHKNELLQPQVVDQLYCKPCERFLADRYVLGTCPGCESTSARGDQCDKCDKLLTPLELIQPRCKVCSKSDVELRSSKHLFLDLPKIRDRLRAWAVDSIESGAWSKNGAAITMAWIDGDIQPRCITRDLKWGTPVPLDEYAEKVFYVWFDAPIGYISISACYTDEWEKWWKNPENVELFQFMGKDNVPFHAVVFPSSLIGAEDNYTLVTHISTTEYLTYEGTKFSKGDSIGVFGNQAQETGIPAEVWRYYLLSVRPESADTDFDWSDFAARNNNELIKNLGNFVNRVLKFVNSSFDSTLPGGELVLTDADQELIRDVNEVVKQWRASFEAVRMREALSHVLSVSRLGNGYLQAAELWTLVKNDKERAKTVIRIAVNLVALVAYVVHPFMPQLTDAISAQLQLQFHVRGDYFNNTCETWFESLIPANHVIGPAAPLFSPIKADRVKELRAKFGGAKAVEQPKKKKGGGGKKKGASPVFIFDVRVGKVLSASDHPESDTLFVLSVDLGEEEPRQILAGLRAYYEAAELVDRRVAVLTNLEKANFGMCLAAKWRPEQAASKEESVVRLIEPPADAAPGSPISPVGVEVSNEATLTKKDVGKVKVKVDADGVVGYSFSGKSYPLEVAGLGPVRSEAPKNTPVK